MARRLVDRQTRACIYLYSMFLFVVVLTALIEYPQTEPHLQIYFILAKCFTAISTIQAIIYFTLKKKYSFWPHLLAFIGFFSFPALGEIFRPTYEYSLMPIFVIGMMLVPIPLWTMLIALGLGTSAFCWVYYIFYERNLALVQTMNVYDNMFTFVTFGVTSGFTAHFLNFERQQKLNAQARFSLIGAQATAIIHDLKNLLSSPRILIENLNELLKSDRSSEVASAIHDIEMTLKQASESALRFNQMAVLVNAARVKLSIKDTAEEVRLMLRHRLRDVKVDVLGDVQIFADQGFATSLFLNLFMNSLGALAQTVDKEIKVIIDKKIILFQDNGCGFPPEVLKSLSKGLSSTTKNDGTGMGLLIIKEACRDLGARVKIYNMARGACVEIQF